MPEASVAGVTELVKQASVTNSCVSNLTGFDERIGLVEEHVQDNERRIIDDKGENPK